MSKNILLICLVYTLSHGLYAQDLHLQKGDSVLLGTSSDLVATFKFKKLVMEDNSTIYIAPEVMEANFTLGKASIGSGCRIISLSGHNEEVIKEGAKINILVGRVSSQGLIIESSGSETEGTGGDINVYVLHGRKKQSAYNIKTVNSGGSFSIEPVK